jgi:hypothetical protein
MPTAADELAEEHATSRKKLAIAAVAAAQRAWSNVDEDDIARSWTALAIGVTATVAVLQRTAAADADQYVTEALEVQGLAPRPGGELVPAAFAGVASDGRPLRTLLNQPAITTLQAIGAGATPAAALRSGGNQLAMLTATQITDAGRVADGVAVTTRPRTGYVRTLSTPSCSRCALLAGRVYRSATPFLRHPRCDCGMTPVAESAGPSAATDTRRYFDSLAEAEQDQIFTADGARAIRDGADINQVVNARRGMSPAGTTSEGSGRGRRLMPERIYAQAGGDRDRALELLRQHGFVL